MHRWDDDNNKTDLKELGCEGIVWDQLELTDS
jgi:hypothetical protein